MYRTFKTTVAADLDRVAAGMVAEGDGHHVRLPIWTDRGEAAQTLTLWIGDLSWGKHAHEFPPYVLLAMNSTVRSTHVISLLGLYHDYGVRYMPRCIEVGLFPKALPAR